MTGSRGNDAVRPHSALIDVRESAQRVANLIAAALHTAVEVVDRDLARLAASGTSPARSSTPPEPALYAACMRSRLPAWADAAGPERRGPLLACPILAAGAAVGAIGLLPILAGQAESLRAHSQEVTDLVTALSEPLRGAVGWHTIPASEARAENTESVLQSVLESVPDGLLAVNTEGVVLYCNRTALVMLRAEMDLTGQILAHWYPPGGSLRDQGAPPTREVVFNRHGHRFRFFETVGPLRTGDRVAGTLIVLRDATGKARIRPSLPTLADVERQLIEDALSRHGTSGAGKRRAARALGVSLSTLYRKLRRPARPRRR